MLAHLGHTVLQATSGDQALRILADQEVDVLLTDYAMPDMTGADLADAALTGWPDLKVIVVTGYAELPTGVTLRFPRLNKPFRQDDLAAALARLSFPPSETGKVVTLRPR
jgi:CheY-like chemotaxis protein